MSLSSSNEIEVVFKKKLVLPKSQSNETSDSDEGEPEPGVQGNTPEDDVENQPQPFIPQIDNRAAIVAWATACSIPVFAGDFSLHGMTFEVGSGKSSSVVAMRLNRTADLIGSISEISSKQNSQNNQSFQSLSIRKKVIQKHVPADGRSGAELKKYLGVMAHELRILSHPTLRTNPNIVDIIGIDWDGNIRTPVDSLLPVLMLEYANCGSLEDFFQLPDIDFSWDLKLKLSLDILNGLEAVDDAGVVHCDLKLGNVLVFRDIQDSEVVFTAKICDFGFALAITDIDAELDAAVNILGFSPPWEAPECRNPPILVENLEKLDVYGYGLLVCRIFTEGGEPFEYSNIADLVSNETPEKAILRLKREDKACEAAKRSVAAMGVYSVTQLEKLGACFEVTIRTDPNDRTEEYVYVRIILEPNVAEEEFERRELFDFDSVYSQLLQPLTNHQTHGIPNFEGLHVRPLPPNVMGAIFEDLFHVVSDLTTCEEMTDEKMLWAGNAAYQLALCFIRGIGVEASPEEGARLIKYSAQWGFARAQREIYRIFQALGLDLPTDITNDRLLGWLSNALHSGKVEAEEDLASLYPESYEQNMRQYKTIYCGSGKDIFGDFVREEYKLDDVCGFFQKIELLPSLHIPDDENISFLHYAASNGAAEVLLRFLQHDSRTSSYLNSKSIYGWTPLYLACAGGHFLAAKYLLEHGADPNIRDDSGRSCLHHLSRFALNEMLEIEKALFDKGADYLAVEKEDGHTPLHSAVEKSTLGQGDSVVRALLERGASLPSGLAPLLEARDADGHSPLSLAACVRLRPDLVLLIQRYLASYSPEVSAMQQAESLVTLIKMLDVQFYRAAGAQYKARLNEVLRCIVSESVVRIYIRMHFNGHSPLHDACIFGSQDIFEFLLTCSFVNIDEQSPKGITPLMASIICSNLLFVSRLLDKGANVNIVDNIGNNCAMYAVRMGLPDLLHDLESRTSPTQRKCLGGTPKYGRFSALIEAFMTECFDSFEIILTWVGVEELSKFRSVHDELPHFSILALARSRKQMCYLLDPSKKQRTGIVVSECGLTFIHVLASRLESASSSDDFSLAEDLAFLFENQYITAADCEQCDIRGVSPLHWACHIANVPFVKVLRQIGVNINPIDNRGLTPFDMVEGRKHMLEYETWQEVMEITDMVELRTAVQNAEELIMAMRSWGARRGQEIQ